MTVLTARFRYPTGARPLLIEETARRRSAESLLVSIAEAAGFSEIALPILDFAEPYSSLSALELRRRSYRFTDRDGELVTLRSDFTPMVARALAPSLTEHPFPLRVFYRGDVIRCELSRLGADREEFQAGAEIVGDASVERDVEILRLTARIARAFGIRPLIVFSNVALTASLGPARRAALLRQRNGTGLAEVRDANPAAADRLATIAAAVADDAAFVMQVDDGEEDAGYYTGLRFRVYGDDARTPLAQGGRYDALYQHFGTDAPAVGFTFSADRLEIAQPAGEAV